MKMYIFIYFLVVILTVNGTVYNGRPRRDYANINDPYQANYYRGQDCWPANPDYYPSYPHPMPWDPLPMPWDPYPMPRDPYPRDPYPSYPYIDCYPYNKNEEAYFPYPVRDAISAPDTDETYYPVRCGDPLNGLPYEELKDYIRNNKHPGPPTGSEDDIPPHNGNDHNGNDHNGNDHNGHDHKGHDHKGHDHKGHDHKGHDHNSKEENVCKLSKTVGPCKASFKRYFYDCADNSCKKFIYGGCQGNGNNFLTLEDCESKCMQK